MIKLQINARSADRVRRGYPWVFKSDITNANEAGSFKAGEARFIDPQGRVVATGYAQPMGQLTGRILANDDLELDHAFFTAKFKTALAWRDRLFPQSSYRLVHSESDGLPGLIIDRFNDTLVIQVNTAGMEALQDIWLPALQEVVPVKNVILKNDSTGRALEGLPENFAVAQGSVPENGLVELIENDTRFFADVKNGQKTGWFFDQRPHRQWVAAQAKGKSVIDIFCHTGAFGVTAGKQGASAVTFVDVSDHALSLAKKNAALNNVTNDQYIEGKAFDVMETMQQMYDIVCVDPPAFVKVKKDMAVGLKGYEKLAKMAAAIVKPGGVLFYASCSSHPTEQEMLTAIFAGLNKAKRDAVLVYTGMAGPDHPVHPQLPETRYLKAFGFRVN